MSDRTAELYELADHVAFDSELKRILTGKRLHDLADQWKAERQAYQSAIEEADRLRFAAEAQAAANRDALEQARAETANLRDVLQDLYDDWQGPSTSSLVAARAALGRGGAR